MKIAKLSVLFLVCLSIMGCQSGSGTAGSSSNQSVAMLDLTSGPTISGGQIGYSLLPQTYSLVLPAGYALASASWNFGDGSPLVSGAGPETYAYSNPGVYLIQVATVDTSGNSSTASFQVNIISNPDGFDCVTSTTVTVPATGTVGTPVTVTANIPSCITSEVTSVTWDFDDGSADPTGTSVQHTFSSAGTYVVTVQIDSPLASTQPWLTFSNVIQITGSATPTPAPTATPVATATPAPSATPTEPTATPAPTATPVPTPTPPPSASSSVPVDTLCSNMRTTAAGSNVTEAVNLELEVLDPGTHTVVCSVTSGVKQAIIADHRIDLSSCVNADGQSLLTGNTYSIEIIDPGVPSKNLLFDSNLNELGTATITRSAPGSSWTYSSGSASQWASPWRNTYNPILYVLFALNPTNADTNNDAATGASCNRSASPLIIDLTPPGMSDSGLQLSSPADGVMFDILGENAPVPHEKIQISWVRNINFMFLTLPKDGQITGIDELFGNNTMGPDGHFAANGYLALAKYDANGDGVINAKDPVFTQLRLWSDKNMDGVAQSGELYTLEQAGITSISLNYNANYFQQDQYGNQIRFRSTSTLTSGVRRMFDIWFALPASLTEP